MDMLKKRCWQETMESVRRRKRSLIWEGFVGQEGFETGMKVIAKEWWVMRVVIPQSMDCALTLDSPTEHFPLCYRRLWPMTFIPSNLTYCQDEPVSQIRVSRSRVILFKSCCPDARYRDARTHRIKCSSWTTKVNVKVTIESKLPSMEVRPTALV